VSREDDAGSETADEHATDATPPTWADLFARGAAVGTTEAEVRETLRGRRGA
jgi:hypothetical protein